MAYTTSPTRVVGASSLGQRFSDLRLDLARRVAQFRLYRTTLNELGMLTDHDLADLGVHRSMIREIAFEAAYNA